MDRLVVSTVVYRPPEEVFPTLLDFPRYEQYADHLQAVRQYGDGGAGTEYELQFSWWKLSYTARSRVTAVDEPHTIDWRLVKDVDAAGRWRVEPFDDEGDDEERIDDETNEGESDAVTPNEGGASRVYFEVEYHPDDADRGVVDLPAFVSFDWVLKKVRPRVEAEAKRVVRRLVADVEGAERPVELTVHESP